MEQILQRVARLEEKTDSLVEKANHLDKCVDELQRSVWKATGIVLVLTPIFSAIVAVVVAFLFRALKIVH